MADRTPTCGITELDIHGLNSYQAQVLIDSRLRKVSHGVYKIIIIHGFHDGTVLRDMIRSRYAAHPRVLRIESGINDGKSTLVLREL